MAGDVVDVRGLFAGRGSTMTTPTMYNIDELVDKCSASATNPLFQVRGERGALIHGQCNSGERRW
jgi:hypothetical protein